MGLRAGDTGIDMPPNPDFSRFTSSSAKASSLIGSPGRLTLAASLLGDARALKAACRAENGVGGTAGSGPFEAAMQLYEDGQWTAAYAAAAVQADAGDSAAALLALLMLRHGAALYHVDFTAEPRRIAQWAKSVIHATARTKLAAARLVAGGPAAQRPPRSTSRRTASPNSTIAIA